VHAQLQQAASLSDRVVPQQLTAATALSPTPAPATPFPHPPLPHVITHESATGAALRAQFEREVMQQHLPLRFDPEFAC
jgi:hypothetical protein